MTRNILTRANYATSRELIAAACHASREHSALSAEALAQFGDHGAQISGVIRDHFPTDIKDRLRELARAITSLSDSAFAARPKRARLTTYRALCRAVAARDGSGFYGPQA